MSAPGDVRIAVVDYGMGNLYSVRRACLQAGLPATVTSEPDEVRRADGVLLPGVGAFGDAMAHLRRRGLGDAVREAAASGTPLMGICLGVQLLMSESHEFGRHEGLGLFEGSVVRLQHPKEGGRALKVPAVGWNTVRPAPGADWQGTPLEGVRSGEFMYFVHSYCVQPADPSVILSATRYGDVEYCSSIARRNVFACQFHPERSGPEGLKVYANWGRAVLRHVQGESAA